VNPDGEFDGGTETGRVGRIGSSDDDGGSGVQVEVGGD
jgi:hypothetical protein